MSTNGTISLAGDAPWGAARPVYWNGYNYFATSTTEKISLFKLASNLGLEKTVVNCPNLVPQTRLNFAYPCVKPANGGDVGEVYFLFPGKYLGPNTGCVYYITATDTKPKLLGGKQSFFGSLEEAQSCSIASNPYGLTLVTLRNTPDAPIFHFDFVKWSDIETCAEVTGFDFPSPPHSGPDVIWTDAAYALAPADNTAGDQATVLLICAPLTAFGSTVKPEGVMLGEVLVDTTGAAPAVDYDSVVWTTNPLPEYFAAGAPLCSVMHMGVDGRVYNVVANWWTTPNDFEQMNPELWRRDGPLQWTNLGYVKGWTGAGGFPGVAYLPGASSETPSTANPDLDDALTPVGRFFLYPGPRNDSAMMSKITYWGDDFGYLRRLALETLEGLQKLLFGIIEGPPPIPNENINIPSSQDPSFQATGVTTFSDSEAGTAGYNINVKAGMVYQQKAEAELGGIGKVTASVEMSGGYSYSEQHQSTTTSGVSYSCEIRLEQDQATQQWKVQQIGAAVLIGMDMAAFSYQYVEPDGTVPASAPIYTQIFPMEMTVTTYPYVLNPNAGPTPGQLLSYIVAPEELNYLQKNASFTITTAGVPTPNLVTAWGLDTKTTTTWQKYESDSYSNGFYFDLKAMLGVKLGGWIQTEESAGVQFHVDGNWTHGTSSTIGLSTQVSTRGNVSAVGTYSYYDFYTFQLNPSYEWAQEFLDNLVTDSWPTDPYERQMNQKLKDMIATLPPDLNGGEPQGPAPWKICYALGEYQLITPVAAAAEGLGVTLSPALAAKLDAAGVSTTAQLQQLMSSNGGATGSGQGPTALPGRSGISLTETEARLLNRILKPK